VLDHGGTPDSFNITNQLGVVFVLSLVDVNHVICVRSGRENHVPEFGPTS
jgi:hypothetical protein